MVFILQKLDPESSAASFLHDRLPDRLKRKFILTDENRTQKHALKVFQDLKIPATTKTKIKTEYLRMKPETILKLLLKNRLPDFPAVFFGFCPDFAAAGSVQRTILKIIFIELRKSESSEEGSDQKFSPKNFRKKIFY